MQQIIGVGIFLSICYIILLFYNNEKSFERHRELSDKDMGHHVLTYEQNLSKSHEQLAKDYIISLPPLIIPVEKEQPIHVLGSEIESTGIPELDYILSNQELYEKSDLRYPFKHESLISAIGEWRCRDDGKVSASEVIHNIKLYKKELVGMGLIDIDCRVFESAEVLHQGNEMGGWLIHLKNSEKCPFYLNDNSGSQCADSLAMYMAEKIATNSRWVETLKLNEEVIIEGMLSVKSMPLEQVISEVFKDYSDRKYTHDKDKKPLVLKQASQDHINVLKSFDVKLPKMILSPNQTFVYFKSHYLTLVRMWDGKKFNTVRITPQLYSDSVVVVAEEYMGTRLIEISSNGEHVYLDVSERKAFRDIESWIKYLLAKRRLFEAGYEFKHFPWEQE